MRLNVGQIFVLLLFFAALAFGLRSRELFNDFTGQPMFGGTNTIERITDSTNSNDGQAQQNDRVFQTSANRLAEIQPSADADTPPAMPAIPEKPTDMALTEDPPIQGEGTEENGWQDYTDAELEYSGTRTELFEDLSERRKDLERRERTLAMREALLQAAEKEINQKFEELNGIRAEIEGLLEQQSEEEEARIQSLVRIYEGMKAKDAARIFNTLETDVLLSVIGRMSERKSAPVIAAMNAERARSVTILLAQQKSLLDLSSQ